MKCPACGREVPKSHDQRKKFHAMCRDIGLHVGETPGRIKEAIKLDFFGVDEYKIGNKWYRRTRSSESAGKDEYSQLIEYTSLWAAENLGMVI